PPAHLNDRGTPLMPLSPDESEFDLPAGATDALRQAYRRPPAVPASLDGAVLGAVRQKFAARRRMRLMVRWGAGLATAAAACVAIALFINTPADRTQLAGPQARPPLNGDLDGSGRVDMTDALLLAKRAASGD